jgi:hypothetical protein
MKLVLLAFLVHVLPRKYSQASSHYICVHGMPFSASNNNPKLETCYLLHTEHKPFVNLTPKHPRDTINQSHAKLSFGLRNI